MKRLSVPCAATLCAAILCPPAMAQDWPQKPVRFIAPFPPGSTADVVARLLGQRLATRTGQQFLVENRAGASGNIGSDLVAKSAPDGYTMGIGTTSTHAVAVTLSRNLPYDPIKDFTAVTLVATSPYVLVAYPKLAGSLQELIALAKKKPGAISYGSAGPASLAALATELFCGLAGIKMTHVPYKSSAQSITDLISGRLDMQIATIAPTLSGIRAGQVRALGVTSTRRTGTLPDVPTFAEAGVPGYEAGLWFALFTPAGLPAPVLTRLNRESVEVLKTPDMKEALEKQGFEPAPGTPEQLASYIRTEVEKWRKVVQSAGIKPE